jgi:hypothetical protein
MNDRLDFMRCVGIHVIPDLRELSPGPKLVRPSACFLLTLEIPLDGGRAGGAAMRGVVSSSRSLSPSPRCAGTICPTVALFIDADEGREFATKSGVFDPDR